MFQGNIVALITPMEADGRLALDRLPGLLDHLLDGGVNGVVAAGTTGESATLEAGEFDALLEAVIAHIDGRGPVLAGTGSASTAHAVEQTRRAAALGADAALVVTPYYNRPTQPGLRAHYETVEEASDLPIVLYNVPSRTAVDLDNATTLALADIPGIVGIKDATGDVARGAALIAGAPEGFAVYSGDDDTVPALMLAGGAGNISVTANIAPKQVADVCAAALAGDAQAVDQLNADLVGLNTAMFLESNPMPVKYALTRMGRIGAGIRLPLLLPEGDAAAVVDAALVEAPQ